MDLDELKKRASNQKKSNKKLLEKYQILIIVKSCNINFIKPAKLEDIIKIKSEIKSVKKVSFFIHIYI